MSADRLAPTPDEPPTGEGATLLAEIRARKEAMSRTEMTGDAVSETTKGHDMSRYWRLVNNEGGLVTGTWWVTRPDEKGRQHVSPIDVVMWSEGRHHGFTLRHDDFTAFVADGAVDPISVRSRHEHVEREAKSRLDEIEAAVLAVVAAIEWPMTTDRDEGA